MYVIMMSGALIINPMDNSQFHFGDINCLKVATELRKSDKVADAFCLMDDPKDEDKMIIGRRVEDGKAAD